ncbi:MAG: hypothetical protein ACKVUT_07260 [Gaiella sp.]
MGAQLRSATTSIVVIGEFNPSTFHPSWFGARELLPAELVETALEGIQAVKNELLVFEAGWLSFQALPGRISFTSRESASHLELRDLALGTLSLHGETSAESLGLNRDSRYRVDTVDEWHAVGDRVAPNEPWAALTDGGRAGLLRLVIQLERRYADVPGHTNVTVGPAPADTPLEILVGINDHFQFGAANEPSSNAARAADVLTDVWEPSRERANAITLHIMQMI